MRGKYLVGFNEESKDKNDCIKWLDLFIYWSGRTYSADFVFDFRRDEIKCKIVLIEILPYQ